MARVQTKTANGNVRVGAEGVTQSQLEALLAARAKVQELGSTLRAAQRSLEVVEAGLAAKLQAGVPVQPGRLQAVVEMVKGAVRVEWKDACYRLAVRFGVNPVELEASERAAKEAKLVPSPVVRITERT